jgi:predicted dehydrogenase
MRSDILKIAVVGSGGVAEAFARNISRCEALHLVGIIARNEERGRVVAELGNTTWHSSADECAEADIYIIAVSDSAVQSVAHGLRISD